MSQKEDLKQTGLYASLMDEVKARIDCINWYVQGKSGLTAPFVRDACWLQLRMLCELVAIGCLVAHGDISMLQGHKIGKTWSADKILDRMAKLRPNFFPFAVTQKVSLQPAGNKHFELTRLDNQPITRDGLLALYGYTHKHLHRGTLKKLLSSQQPLDLAINVPEIVAWAQKINDLLSIHSISINEKRVFMCVLRNADDNNKVNVAIANAP